jgi:succinyl-diaminopimelate desuccinylase
MINKFRLLSLTRRLIRINSENPPGDESRIAAFVAGSLKDAGLKVRIYAFKKKRGNVVAVLGGESGKHSLLITPHLDTVPAGRNWKFAPLAAKIKNNKIYGLGATDCKGNLACAMEALQSLAEDGFVPDYNLVFAATADEECGSGLGLIPLLKKKIIRPEAAVVLDSDDFKIITTQKGLIHLKVKVQGKRAHGAYPDRGINAIDKALEAIREIKALKFLRAKDKFLRPPTINLGTIRGGDKVNVVADWCEFELDLRFLPGEPVKALVKKIKGILAKHCQRYKIEIESLQQPYRISRDHPLVRQLSRAMRKEKARPQIRGSEGATVITFFQHKNIPALATGFGASGCCHTADEFVKVNNLYKGAQVLEEFLKNYKF